MSMVQSSDEHSTACLGNKSWRLPVIWKCIRNSLSVWMIPTNVLVYGRTWYIWIVVVIISEYWDWNWTTCMETNEKILICLQAIKIHSDATSSYALMQSYRRGLWWISNESKPLPAYTTMVVSLWFSFLDFPKFSQWGITGFIYWMVDNDDDFCPSIFPMGFLGLYFSVQSKTVSWALVSRIGLRGVFDGRYTLGTQQSRPTISNN